VEEIIDAFAERYEVQVESVSTADESVFFPLPRELRGQVAE
jgi:4-hydroxy-3-methylbut-2-en-1-yl diphosphate reductase